MNRTRRMLLTERKQKKIKTEVTRIIVQLAKGTTLLRC